MQQPRIEFFYTYLFVVQNTTKNIVLSNPTFVVSDKWASRQNKFVKQKPLSSNVYSSNWMLFAGSVCFVGLLFPFCLPRFAVSV